MIKIIKDYIKKIKAQKNKREVYNKNVLARCEEMKAAIRRGDIESYMEYNKHKLWFDEAKDKLL